MELQTQNDRINHECRICFDIENEINGNLISPCKCKGFQKFIHEECLKKWRKENITTQAYLQCEICKTDYIIENRNIKEDFFIRFNFIVNNNSSQAFLLYIFYAFCSGFLLLLIDTTDNLLAINIVTFGKPEKLIKAFNETQSANIIVFYSNFSTSCFFWIIHTVMFIKLLLYVKQKKIYCKKILKHVPGQIISFFNPFLLYGLFLSTESIFFYSSAQIIAIIYQFIGTVNFCNIHNSILHNMNANIEAERILSRPEEEVETQIVIRTIEESKLSENVPLISI